jgi:hypothetical protein
MRDSFVADSQAMSLKRMPKVGIETAAALIATATVAQYERLPEMTVQ